MLGYIGPIIVLTTGVLGIFFAKGGERQKLTPIAYIFLALVVLSGVVSVLGVYLANNSADARDKAEKQKTAEAQAEAIANARQAASLRGLLMARSFEPTDRPADALLIFDLPVSEAETRGENDPRGPLWPLIQPGVRGATIRFNIEGVVDIDYRLRKAGQSFDIEAHWYEDEEHVCQLKSDDGFEFQPGDPSKCVKGNGYVVSAGLDRIPWQRPFLIKLPNEMFLKTYSRIEQVQRIAGKIGELVIEADSEAEMPALLAAAREIVPTLKFFRPYLQSGAKDEDECVTSLIVLFETVVRKTGPRTITIDIPRMASSDLNFCEISQAS